MLAQVLQEQGEKGVDMVKAAVSRFSATKETENSIRYESTDTGLKIFAREFIEAMETGRGPRKSSTDGGFKDKMLEYMKIKGIGTGLTDKKREALAKFLVLKINKEGDKLYKSGGGRDVYSSVLEKFMEQLLAAVTNDQVNEMTKKVTDSLKGIK